MSSAGRVFPIRESDFLLDHAPRVQANIIDERLRKHLSA